MSAPRIMDSKAISGAGTQLFNFENSLLVGECSRGKGYTLAITFGNSNGSPTNVPYATLLSLMRSYFLGVKMTVGDPAQDEWLHNLSWDFLRDHLIDAMAMDWLVNGVLLEAIANLSVPATVGGTFLFEGRTSYDHRRLADPHMLRPGASLMKRWDMWITSGPVTASLPAGVTITAVELTIFELPAYGPDRIASPSQSFNPVASGGGRNTWIDAQTYPGGALLYLAERTYPQSTTPIGRVRFKTFDGADLIDDAQVAYNAPGGLAAQNFMDNYNDPVKPETTGGPGASAPGVTPIFRVPQGIQPDSLAASDVKWQLEQLDFGTASVASPDFHAIIVPAFGAGMLASLSKNLGGIYNDVVGVRAASPGAQAVRDGARQVNVLPLDLVSPASLSAMAQPGVRFTAGQPVVHLPTHIAAGVKAALATGSTAPVQALANSLPASQKGSGWFNAIKSSVASVLRKKSTPTPG